MIRTVFIDIDDTLLDFGACAKEAMMAAFASCSLEYHDDYYACFLAENERLWQMIERGELTVEELHHKRWQGIFELLGIDYDGINFERLFVDNLHRAHVRMKGAKELLGYLSGRYALFAASNALYQEQVERLTLAELIAYFDGVYTSELAGIAKPDRRFFDYCCLQSGSVPQECVMIGDSYSSDVLGARAAGIRMIWFNHHLKTVPADFEGEVVYSLAEIEHIL